MRSRHYHILMFVLLVGIPLLAFSGWAAADPPSRVARLGYSMGSVSFSPAGEIDWDEAIINRPLTTGDRLWAERGARAEIQAGGATIRMDGDTGLTLLNLDDQTIQLQLTQGVLNVRVRYLEPDQVFEIDTPNLAFTLRKPGAYRIEVDPDVDATVIIARKGKGEAYAEGASYIVDYKRAYRFLGSALGDYEFIDTPRFDDFDRWTQERDRIYDASISARYVSRDVIGYQDLDANGKWRDDSTYGKVWFPSNVDADWAPYRDGHWAWIDPWGWTWVDDQPWGFTVSHYGRWANLRGNWGWIPGPRASRAYYAPALVVFLGGADFSLTLGSGDIHGTAWFPLGPREVYRPSYAVSRGYFESVNYSNTIIDRTVLRTYYDQPETTAVVYANRRVAGAVVAVPTTLFASSGRVSKGAVRLSVEMAERAPQAFAPHVVPTEQSVHGAANHGGKPPERVFQRPVVARSVPPPAHPGFAAHQPQLTAKPGRPLDEESRKAVKAEPKAKPVVKVIPKERVVPATTRPPRVAGPQGKDKGVQKEMRQQPQAAQKQPAAQQKPARPQHDPAGQSPAPKNPRPQPQSAPAKEQVEQAPRREKANPSGKNRPEQQEPPGQGQESGEGDSKGNRQGGQSPDNDDKKHK